MKRLLSYGGLLLLIIFLFSIANGLAGHFVSSAAPRYQDKLRQIYIQSYRSWQSVGIRVKPGDLIDIEANGEWLYTPNEYHGPDGHPRYPAPSFYPIGWGAGGALIGRIGEHGAPFVVGSDLRYRADGEGTIYLRINDDILSDNKGNILVDITVTPADPEYR